MGLGLYLASQSLLKKDDSIRQKVKADFISLQVVILSEISAVWLLVHF